MKYLLLLTCTAIMFSCNTKEKEKTIAAETKIEANVEKPIYGDKKFAIVWKWTTTNKQLVIDNAPAVSQELTNLWKRGIVENAYYDSDAKIDKFEFFPNITFFLKTESYETAEVILNNLTVVKKGIAVYTIYPVGTLWLGRKTDKINAKGITKSYVAVWTKNQDAKPTNELIVAQNDATIKLWNEGIIENVYFDIEGVQKANNETDFVFFVNANSEAGAKEICDKLPFSMENIASYQLLSVGVFWMGVYK